MVCVWFDVVDGGGNLWRYNMIFRTALISLASVLAFDAGYAGPAPAATCTCTTGTADDGTPTITCTQPATSNDHYWMWTGCSDNFRPRDCPWPKNNPTTIFLSPDQGVTKTPCTAPILNCNSPQGYDCTDGNCIQTGHLIGNYNSNYGTSLKLTCDGSSSA